MAGVARGRRLEVPDGLVTRPTSDRVREAVFSSLASMGAVEAAAVVDLFAGSGALGIEALSRGAASAVFVEADRGALGSIRANLAALGLATPRATVVAGDAVEAAGSPQIVEAADVVLADPPYRFDQWASLLERLVEGGFGGLLVAESAVAWQEPSGWRTVRRKVYGGTLVSMLRPGIDR